MYKYQDIVQYSIYDFILPFGGHLNPDNRWVRLAQEIDWKIIDDEYSAFSLLMSVMRLTVPGLLLVPSTFRESLVLQIVNL